MMGLLGLLLALLFILIWKTIGRGKPLDWQDLIAERIKDGGGTRVVASPKKLTLLIGTVIGSWAVITMAYSGKLDYGMFGLYLAFCGGVEGFSTWMKVKAAQTETPSDHKENSR